MDNTKIRLIKFNHTRGSVVRIGNEIFNYAYNGCIIFRLKYSLFDENNDILDDLRQKGFKYVDDFSTNSTIELNVSNVNKQKEFKGVDFAVLIKPLKKDEVLESFTYTISFQVKGKRISEFYPLSRGMDILDERILTFKTFVGNEKGEFGNYGLEADDLFGPRYITQNGYLSDQGRYPWEYRIQINEIEKIFLEKEFRDIRFIGTENERLCLGNEECITLDLQNPDMEVYEKFVAIENCIEIQW